MKPRLTLTDNLAVDIKNAQNFVRSSKFVSWFLPAEIDFILKENLSILERNRIIKEYTTEFYAGHKSEIKAGVRDTTARWAKIETKFYRLTNKLFEGHEWPKGKYSGYASIYHMFPRYIDKRIFFFPYSKNKIDPIRVIAHELLHFIFFDFIKSKYGIKENEKFKNQDPRYLWRISEAFNTIIENWQPYKDILDYNERRKPYPECQQIYTVMRRRWKNKQNIHYLLEKMW